MAGRSRGARKAAQNKKTKAAHAASTKKHWDELGEGEKVSWGDIGEAAAGGIPFVGGALTARNLASGVANTTGGLVGAAGDAGEVAAKAGVKAATRGAISAAGQVAGIVGAADALKQAGELFNKKQYQELSEEEKQKRRTITSAQRRGRRSPVSKLESPFKQTAHERAQANNPYYNYLQLGGWDEAQNEIAAQREQQAKARQSALQEQLSNLQLAELKTKQQEGLIVPANTGYNNIDIAIQGASRQLVDQAGALTAKLKNGEIDTDQYATDLAIIRSQVPAINTFKENLTGNLQGYTEALQNGQISHAMGAEARDFYGTLLGDSGQLQLGATPEGNVALVGFTNGGEEVSIPVQGSGQMPKPILKQPAPYELLKDPIKQLQQQAEFWGPDAQDFAKGQLDNVLTSGGEGALKSLAADHYGYSLEKIEELENTPAEGYSSELERQIEDRWVKSAETMFVNDQINAEQARQFQLQQDRLNAQQQQGGAAASASLLNYQFKQAENQQNIQRLNTAAQNPGGFASFNGFNGLNVEYSEPGYFSGGSYTVTDSKGNKQKIPEDQAYDFFFNTLGVVTGPQSNQNQSNTNPKMQDIKF